MDSVSVVIKNVLSDVIWMLKREQRHKEGVVIPHKWLDVGQNSINGRILKEYLRVM